MKPEKEFEWIVKLFNSKFKRGAIRSIGGCKADFEREVGTSENNKEFRVWLDGLIKQGVLEFLKKNKRGNFGKEVNTYVVNFNKLESLLEKNPLYNPAKRCFDRKKLIYIDR